MSSRPLIQDLLADAPPERPLAGALGGVALLIAGALLIGGLLWAAGGAAVAIAFAGGLVLVAGAVLFLGRRTGETALAEAQPATDWALVSAAIGEQEGTAVIVTDPSGVVRSANAIYERWFPDRPSPGQLPEDKAGTAMMQAAVRDARRDGHGRVERLERRGLAFTLTVDTAGRHADHLVWRVRLAEGSNLAVDAARLLTGPAGERLGEAGVMGLLLTGAGRIEAANRVFAMRAGGRGDAIIAGRDLGAFMALEPDGRVRFVREETVGGALRLVQVPLDPSDGNAPTLVFILDDEGGAANGAQDEGHVETLLAMLPFALALADRDGRFLFLNGAFSRAAGLPEGATPVYPGDLVVREDKGAVADAVRRFATGQALSGDISVRLRSRPDEQVALSIAGARGLGDAAVLLSLKDNTEESKLKRQVAQATKMQAVGQLAGGIAHDFNNILTAIIGHCDLMLMRHTPGDSDYDDIQQVRANSNRAASLTRQLLAFSRQQTLRPQTLQLPDVISEVFNLLKRLLGETIGLNVTHGRALGAVRADPGQLEQVIVNLVVNARDAIQAKGEAGTVTLQTFSLSAAEVKRMNSDILPVGDYTAMSVTDTGTGIPPDILSKIFEPFFTTKEVGKGTGLGLSTVYGIVKQSGGFIFAESEVGEGTRFVIYLPVHKAETASAPAPLKEKGRAAELWGSGTILLVEDEDMVRAVAERALSRHGYKVLTAAHGEEALEILEDGAEIDLLVTDVMMPTMDGPTLVRHARERMPHLPILFMSGYAEEQLRKSITIERVSFLPKPFSVQQLAEAARDTLAAT
ncbi:two-component system cell cycle sensor histidine kinase/response regulator CckA [Sphingomonas jejuensis]|uniref:histidine kinase n=1 Tax=Sphingomonas jejuensis TaxID=904715 RepID=A0ABX0XJ78_9SPHN|nr:PAS domain-containing sensor histidine kinase [Sphingomonas jejuensis]NJC33218.1 two-component system cell cycle sensor histidine kinase/response regulator CckA [Sphingomonas jejuensis]